MIDVFAAGDVQPARLPERMLIGTAVEAQAYADLFRRDAGIIQPLRIGEEPAFHIRISLLENGSFGTQRMPLCRCGSR